MRTIRVPEGHIDVPGTEPGIITFTWFVKSILNMDGRFNSAGPGIRAAVRIERAMEKAQAADGETEKTFFLEESDWTLLRDAVESPSGNQYPLSPARVLAGYIEAITESKS